MAASRLQQQPYAPRRNFLRVEGDYVQSVTEVVDKTVKLDDFVNNISSRNGLTTPILPLGCRFYRQARDNQTSFVIEIPPTVRQLVWTDMERKTKFRLAFPFCVFVINFVGDAVNEGRIFYRNAPLTTLTDRVMHTNLCNVSQVGLICTGSMRCEGSTLTAKAEDFVSKFWHSQFNTDLSAHCWQPMAEAEKKLESLTNWEKATTENPLFPLSIDWRDCCTISAALNQRG